MQKQSPKEFYKKVVLKYFAIFTGKHLCWSLFITKKKRLQRRCFSVNIAKFLRIPIFKNICERLLFYMAQLLMILKLEILQNFTRSYEPCLVILLIILAMVTRKEKIFFLVTMLLMSFNLLYYN